MSTWTNWPVGICVGVLVGLLGSNEGSTDGDTVAKDFFQKGKTDQIYYVKL